MIFIFFLYKKRQNPHNTWREETDLIKNTGSYCMHLIHVGHGVYLPTEQKNKDFLSLIRSLLGPN